jgi:hypothetical protein
MKQEMASVAKSIDKKNLLFLLKNCIKEKTSLLNFVLVVISTVSFLNLNCLTKKSTGNNLGHFFAVCSNIHGNACSTQIWD